MSASEREEAIERICAKTGKTREQAEAFLDVMGSAFRRRGWAKGEPVTQEQISERIDTFIGQRTEDPADDNGEGATT